MKGAHENDDNSSSSEAPLPRALGVVFETKNALFAAVLSYCESNGDAAKPDAKMNNKTRVAYVCGRAEGCEVRLIVFQLPLSVNQ